ncbi:SDR family oxidoreductase, partial [Vibrio vulnificus]|uniref:hypothetical protein n=1 Tax=Vibrio vulnificus TaxID=672 RepID=UPI0019F6DC11
RDLSKLQALADRIYQDTGRYVEFIGADLTTLEGQRRVGQVLETDSRISLLLNNAGVGATQSLVESDVNRLCNMIKLNVIAVTH